MLALILASSLGVFMQHANAVTHQAPYETGRFNAGTPNSSTVVHDGGGNITGYGDSAINYNLPDPAKFNMTPAQFVSVGRALYMQSCASCHGADASGVPSPGTTGDFPSLINESTASVDFWIETGRMPAANPRDTQALRKAPKFNQQQSYEIAAWIATLSSKPSYPFIPKVNTNGAYVANGASLFALNCAACHTITGMGDALAFGTYAPSLYKAPAYQVAEAIRIGPGNMPKFSGNLSDSQVRDIVAYVTEYIQHPANPGGLGLGGLGPVAEGFIGLSLGVGLLALAGFWVGERQ